MRQILKARSSLTQTSKKPATEQVNPADRVVKPDHANSDRLKKISEERKEVEETVLLLPLTIDVDKVGFNRKARQARFVNQLKIKISIKASQITSTYDPFVVANEIDYKIQFVKSFEQVFKVVNSDWK